MGIIQEVFNPVVSVIVPMYNAEKYIERCLNSITKQVYTNIEIVLVNDCSTDKTDEICNHYKKKDQRVKYIENKKNLGVSTTRNIGILNSKGQYILFVDSDDYIDDNCVDILIHCVQEHDADLVLFGCDLLIKGNRKECFFYNSQKSNTIDKKDAFKRLFDGNDKIRAIWGKMIKRELFSELLFPDGMRFGEDMYVTSELIQKAKNIFQVNKNMYIYNQDVGSLVRSPFSKEKLEMVAVAEKWIKDVQYSYPELREDAVAFKYRTIIDFCSLIKEDENKKYYEMLKRKIKTEYKEIKCNKALRINDKIKAVLIYHLNYCLYRKVRLLISIFKSR